MERTGKSKEKKILGAAKTLFWKHGFKRVTVEEICLKAGVSKMTFYRFFENKIDLAKSVYDMVIQDGIDQFHLIMNQQTSPEEKIKKILLLKHEGTNHISQEFILDFYNSKELGLSEYIEFKTRESWEEVLKELKNGQKKGWFRKDFNPETILLIAQKFTELLSDTNFTDKYPSTQDAIMEITSMLMYGILPRK